MIIIRKMIKIKDLKELVNWDLSEMEDDYCVEIDYKEDTEQYIASVGPERIALDSNEEKLLADYF